MLSLDLASEREMKRVQYIKVTIELSVPSIAEVKTCACAARIFQPCTAEGWKEECYQTAATATIKG